MLTSLLRFEMRYHFGQITFQAAAILFFSLGILMTHGSFGGSEVHKNGPYVTNFIVCLLSIFMIFVSALFCGNVVLRDTSHRTDALIFTTGISKRVYFGIKLAGLLLSVFLIMCIAVLGILAGSAWLLASQKGGFQMLNYLQPLLLFGLPNALFCSSFIFATALWTQNVRAVYVSGVFLFILYFTASIFGNSPLMATSALKPGGPGLVSVLADPFGLTTFFSETKNWPLWRRNHGLYPIKGAFLANRMLWTGIALLSIALSYNRFRLGLHSEKQVRKSATAAAAQTAVTYSRIAAQPSGTRYFWSAFHSQFRLDLAFLFKQQHFLVIAALWMFLYGVELKENLFHGQYGVRFYPTTALVIEQLLSVRPALLLLIFYASELVHREQGARMQALVFSTPMPHAALFLAKTGTLAVLITGLISCNIITGICVQWVAGYRDIALAPYLFLFYYSGFQLLLLAVLIVFIQTIIPNKYLGMLLSLVIVGVIIFGKMLGIDQYLLRFGSAPAPVYSEVNGFGHYVGAFNGYMLFWALLACLLGLCASRWWPAGTHDSWWQRMNAGLKSWSRVSRIVAGSILLTMLCTGFYIVQKSKGIDPGNDSQKDILWQVRYERRYKAIPATAQPVITAVKIETDIYPDEQRYEVSGKYTLKNGSPAAISKLWLAVDPAVDLTGLDVPGAAQKSSDQEFKQYFYELKEPLLPGSVMVIDFSLRIERSGFRPFDSENSVVGNGSYIELEKFLPFFGYNERYEPGDRQVRSQNGLKPQTIPVETDYSYHFVDFENTISTQADQQVVTVGNLQKSWKAGNRSYFHYKTARPIAFMFALSSARYAVTTEMHNGTTFRIFHQPGQTHNVPAMMQAMKDAIGYGNAEFGRYPLSQLTLAEIPAYRGAATAYPGVIFSNEKYNFLVDASDTSRLNFVYATTVHETAHQWWAHQIHPQTGAGDAFLTESLAKYTEAMVAEKHLGKMRLCEYLRTDNELYFSLRNMSGRQELPLCKTWEQPFVYYQKGGLAMYALREILGEKRVNGALKTLITNHAFPAKRPSPDDFIGALTRNATPFEQRMIRQHLKEVIVYDNRIKILSSGAVGHGKYKLRLLVTIQKTDETGPKPRQLQTDDLVDIAVFGMKEPAWNQHSKPAYLQKHHFVKPQTVIELILNEQPAVVAVDPYGYLLDSDSKNNQSALPAI